MRRFAPVWRVRAWVLWAVLAAGFSSVATHAQTPGGLRSQHVIHDRGFSRTFEIARDEIAVVDAQGQSRVQAQAAAPDAEAARTRAVALKGDLVVYEAGQPRSERSRRIVRREVAVQLRPGADPQAVATAVGLRVARVHPSAPGFILFEAPDSGTALTAAEALRARAEVLSAEPQLARQQQKRFLPNDPLFAQQWHLRNTGQGSGVVGTDVNITSVWDTYKGSGIRIGIVDDGLQTTHPDLSPNVDTVNDHDWNDSTPDDPNPTVSVDFHGSSCAGVAAARGNNGVGVSGAAPEATLVGLRLIGGPATDSQEAEALGWKNDIIPIKSNSWGPNDDGVTLEAPGALTKAALQTAATTGRGGRGTIFLWAAGNGGDVGDNSNYDGYANSIYTIAVAALANDATQAYYSEPGADVVVTAPSSSDGVTLGIVTTDLAGTKGYNTGAETGELSDTNYTNTFGGTSSATPLVAGCVALMLQANPNLGWRDVQEILIQTAKKVNPTDTDWVTNAAGYHFNHKFGAGLIDTQAAVAAALSRANLGSQKSDVLTSTVSTAIPDNNATGVTRTFNFTSATVSRVEQVTVKLTVSTVPVGQLEVTLTSPSGISSRLAQTHSDTTNRYTGWTFESVRHWGENPNGTWTLRVADRKSGSTGALTLAEVTIFGSDGTSVNSPPTVALTAPSAGQVFSPGSTVTLSATASDLTATGSAGVISKVEFFNGATSLGVDTTAPYSLSWLSPPDGSYSLTAAATDSEGATGTSPVVSITVGVPPAQLLVEDFASAASGDNTTTSGSGTAWPGNANFPTVSGAYQAGGAVKLGTSSGSGSITSKPLDLSGNGGKFSVQFDVKGWTTVEGDISISVTGLTTQTVSYTALRTGSFETKTVSFTGGTANSTVTIATTAKRAFIDNVSILTQSSGGTGAPTVVTGTTSGITSNAATLGGTISAIGAGNATERGFYWSTTSGFANGTGTKVSTTGSFSSGAYTQNVTGLTSSTTYYYKAFATGPGGTGYGAQATWTTLGTATPALTLSPAALSAFTTAFGTPSASQSFTVSGSALTASVTLSAPSGFELATASAGPYAASLSLTPSSGTLASTTIFVRLSATASGSPSGSITASSAGATSQTKAVSGTVSGGGGGGTASLLAGWDFQTTSNGGTAVRASPNTPTAFVANFGTGTLYLNATNGSSNWATASELNGFGGTAVNAGTGFSTSTTTPASLALVGSSANSKSIVFKVNMTGQKDLIISYATQDSGTGFSSHTWARSTDATTWTTVQTISSIPSSFATQTLPAISALNGVANAYLRLTVAGASSTSGNNRLDNIQFTATPSASGPTIAASGTLAALDTAYGTPTPAPGSFSLAGNSLTAGITLTPPAGFELSSAGPVSGYAGSGVPITIGTAGDVASTTIYIRLAASAPVGTYSGNVVCSSSGATSVNVPTVSSAMSKAPLFVSAADATRVYGAQNPSFVLSYTGFVNGQSETVLTSLPLASTSATVSSPPGIYSIVVSGGSAANYAFSYVNGELSVSAAPLPSNEILFSPPPSFIQDSTAKTFTVTSSKAQSFSVIYRGRKATRYGPSIEAPIVAGDYLVTATSTDANYEGTASVEFSIFASAFAQWLAGYPLATDVSPGGDPDHDGLPNLMEYFMGLDPSQNDALNAFTPERAGQIWSLVYRRSKTATGVTGAVTWTADPAAVVPWSSSGITDSLVSDQGIYEIRKASLNAGSSPGARFLHLEVLP